MNNLNITDEEKQLVEERTKHLLAYMQEIMLFSEDGMVNARDAVLWMVAIDLFHRTYTQNLHKEMEIAMKTLDESPETE